MWVVIFQVSLISGALLDHCNQFFVDSQGLSCEDYDDNNYCNEDGSYGYNWNNSAAPHGLISGTFDDYSVDSESALYCPKCGCTDEYTNAPDPYAVLYEDGRVLEIYIAMDPDDWNELRIDHSPASIWNDEGQCYKEPIKNDFTWFRANITWNGETLVECGVRKKGSLGSVIGDGWLKPSLKIDTDEFVDDQEFGGWLERFTLNNNIQGLTINQCLVYRLFRNMGVSAPRCNFAKVYVNDEYKGLYSNVEPIKKAFLRQNFDDYDDGNLYEGTLGDFDTLSSGVFEKKTNKGDDDWSDLQQVIDALDAGSYDDLAEIINVEKFLTFWSAEVILGHIDGLANNQNNVYFYLNDDGKFEFIPWGADQVFMAVKWWELSRMSLYRSVMVVTRLPYFLYTEHQDLFVSEMQKLLSSSYWNVTEILIWAKELTEIALAHGSGYNYGDDTDRFPESDYADELLIISNWISSRRDILLNELLPTPIGWYTAWTPKHYYQRCFGINPDPGGSNCVETKTVAYASEDACEWGEGIWEKTISMDWANNCDEVWQVYNDILTARSSWPEVGEWGKCIPATVHNPDDGGIWFRYECSATCSEDTSVSDDAGVTTAITIGSVVGGLLIILVGVICYRHRKHLAKSIEMQHSPTTEGRTGTIVV